MTWRELASHVLAPAGLALAVALALTSAGMSGESPPPVRPTVLVGDDLLRVFQEGKDAAEQTDPHEQSLGTAFDPQPPQPSQSDYR